MKIVILVIVFALVGAAAGVGASYLELERLPKDPVVVDAANVDFEATPRPKVVVDNAEYDFGKMEQGATQSHEFVVSNNGNAPLELSTLTTTCKCTIGDFGANEVRAVLPGGSTKITLEWTAKAMEGSLFRQEATIRTNDPTRPMIVLAIQGDVIFSHRVVPDRIVLDGVSVGSGRTAYAKVYSSDTADLKITDHEFTDKQTEKFFDVKTSAMGSNELIEDAKSGQLVEVTAKAGMPAEPIRQTLKLHTNLEHQPVIEVPIEGTVRGDISIAGRNLNSDNNTLNLGTVSSRKGTSAELKLLVRGPSRRDVAFKVVHVEPDDLRVSIGDADHKENVTIVTVKIEVPPGARPGNYLGSQQGRMGEIRLETGHPETKELTLRLKMLIEG